MFSLKDGKHYCRYLGEELTTKRKFVWDGKLLNLSGILLSVSLYVCKGSQGFRFFYCIFRLDFKKMDWVMLFGKPQKR